MDFKAPAREVLNEVGHPLHYTDITEIALEDNPKTPFVQSAPGVYGLKSAFERLGDAVY